MLHTILDAFESRDLPVNVQTLSLELEIDAAALEGMLEFWVRKGRLAKRTPAMPDCALCNSICRDDSSCPLMASLPVTYAKTTTPLT
jgi:hypothetical protein